MSFPQPIETIYQGYRFRSRLEARWAVFFDALRVPWEYEKEGFNLGDTWYLPDFYFPVWQAWGEVKPTIFTQEEYAKTQQLPHTCLLLAGVPAVQTYPVTMGENEFAVCESGKTAYVLYLENSPYGKINLTYSIYRERLWFDCGEGLDQEDKAMLSVAVSAARAARFEFGEHGSFRR